MKYKFIRYLRMAGVVFFALLIPLTTFSQGPETYAQKELDRQAISFTADHFVTHAKQGDAETVRLFLTAGMNPNVKDKDGMTPLLVAADKGHTATVQVLLEKGADPNVKGMDGFTALTMAADKGHTAIVQALLEKGADQNVKGKDGVTPVLFAADKGRTAIVQLIEAIARKKLAQLDILSFHIRVRAVLQQGLHDGCLVLLNRQYQGCFAILAFHIRVNPCG